MSRTRQDDAEIIALVEEAAWAGLSPEGHLERVLVSDWLIMFEVVDVIDGRLMVLQGRLFRKRSEINPG